MRVSLSITKRVGKKGVRWVLYSVIDKPGKIRSKVEGWLGASKCRELREMNELEGGGG